MELRLREQPHMRRGEREIGEADDVALATVKAGNFSFNSSSSTSTSSSPVFIAATNQRSIDCDTGSATDSTCPETMARSRELVNVLLTARMTDGTTPLHLAAR